VTWLCCPCSQVYKKKIKQDLTSFDDTLPEQYPCLHGGCSAIGEPMKPIVPVSAESTKIVCPYMGYLPERSDNGNGTKRQRNDNEARLYEGFTFKLAFDPHIWDSRFQRQSGRGALPRPLSI
jgi:hypothetical protein